MPRDLGWDIGPGRPGPRGPRRGRKGGDVRAAALLLLEEAPAHGYHLIQQIGERSGNAWKPSPGSIYPVLQQLEDEGFIEFDRVDGRKTAQLTPAGQAYVNENRETLGTPWDVSEFRRGLAAEQMALMKAGRSLAMSARQIMEVGSPTQHAEATAILTEARKKLYGILASDEQ